jgi:hypothetical protein
MFFFFRSVCVYIYITDGLSSINVLMRKVRGAPGFAWGGEARPEPPLWG